MNQTQTDVFIKSNLRIYLLIDDFLDGFQGRAFEKKGDNQQQYEYNPKGNACILNKLLLHYQCNEITAKIVRNERHV